jgi:hypothetical protein
MKAAYADAKNATATSSTVSVAMLLYNIHNDLLTSDMPQHFTVFMNKHPKRCGQTWRASTLN